MLTIAFAALALTQSPPKLTLPDTPLGRIARQWVDTLNTGDAKQVDRLFRDTVGFTPSANDFILVKAVMKQSQGVEVEAYGTGSGHLAVWLKAKSQGKVAQMVLFAGQGERLGGFAIVPTMSPKRAKEFELPPQAVPEKVLSTTLDKWFDRLAKEDIFSGTVAIVKGKQTILRKGYGFANRDDSVPNSPQTKFHLGSMNKMFTAILAARLVEAGKLSWDDPVFKSVPEYPKPDDAKSITLKQLATHTSGLGSLFSSSKLREDDRYESHLDYLPAIADEKLQFEPGKGYAYSNAGFILLGAIIEKATGRSYYDLVQEQITGPLSMKTTGFFSKTEVVSHRAVGYLRPALDPFGMEPRQPNWDFLGYKGNACGGGYSTVDDMIAFGQALHTDKLLPSSVLDTMGTSQEGRAYGFGFQTWNAAGKRAFGHTGGGPSSGIDSAMATFADGSYTIAILGNYDAPAVVSLVPKVLGFLAKQDAS